MKTSRKSTVTAPASEALKVPRTKKKTLSAATIPTEQHCEIETFGYEPNHEDISLLAQRIYEEEGSPPGCAEKHWLEAERRLRQEAATAVSG